jgi:hypothetical protein
MLNRFITFIKKTHFPDDTGHNMNLSSEMTVEHKEEEKV